MSPDLTVISLGAGVQSTAMYLLACDGVLAPRPDAAVFADTQDESTKTMAWLARLESIGTIPIVRATAGSLAEETLRSMRETPSGFCPIPTYIEGAERESQGRRQCTRTHKTDVVYRACRTLLGLEPRQRSKPDRVDVWIGISTDEAHRAKPSRYPLLRSRWPLLYDHPMRRADCARYVERTLGATPPRSSCVYCPFRSDRDWIAMKRDDPESFARAVAHERDIRAIDPRQYLHDSCTPIGEVDFQPDRTLDLFGAECEGMCGV